MSKQATIKFIGLTRVTTSLGYYLTIPLLGVVALQVGSMSAAEVGILVAAHTLFRRGLAVPTGVLCDRWGAERILLLGLGMEAVGYLLLASSITFPIWLLALTIDGAGGAAYNSAGRVLLAKASDDSNSATVFAGFYVLTNVGALLGPLIAALISSNGSPRLVLALSAVAYLGSALAALLRYRAVDRSTPTFRAGSAWKFLMQPLANRVFLAYCAMTIPLWFGISLLVAAVPLEAAFRKLSYFDVGLINSLNALVVVALGHLVGKKSEKWCLTDRMKFLGVGALLMAAGCLVCLLTGPLWLYTGMLVITLGELALIVTADVVAVQLAPEGSPGVYLGYITSAWAVGGVLAGLAAGQLLDGSAVNRIVFWIVSAGFLTIAAVCLTTLGRWMAHRTAAVVTST
jgi:MFS transporter, DHA1 family, multidrug resistance protein